MSVPQPAKEPGNMQRAIAARTARREAETAALRPAANSEDALPASQVPVNSTPQPCLTSPSGTRAPEPTARVPEAAESAPTRPVSSESTASTSAVNASVRRPVTLALSSTAKEVGCLGGVKARLGALFGCGRNRKAGMYAQRNSEIASQSNDEPDRVLTSEPAGRDVSGNTIEDGENFEDVGGNPVNVTGGVLG